MASDLTARRFFLFLLIAASVLLAAMIRPLASSLFLAAALAGVLFPLNWRLAKRLHNRRSLAAGFLVFGLVILMLGPVAALSAFVVNEAAEGVTFITATLRDERVLEWVHKLPRALQDSVAQVLQQLPQTQGARAAAAGWAAVTATGQIVIQLVLMLIALFFLLIQGEELVLWLDHALPLRRGQTRELLADFKTVSYAVVISTLITAAVQAVAALIGFLIARVPHPVFFGAVTFFCAIIPAVGAASVCLVAAQLLLVTGHPYMAIFLSIWGLAIVGLVDNLVKPMLLKGEMQMPGAIVFFSLLGGLAAFGIPGLLLGPLVTSLFVALVRMYERDFRVKAEEPTP